MTATKRAADTLIIFAVILVTWQALHQWVGSTALPSTVISRLSEERGAPWATATL